MIAPAASLVKYDNPVLLKKRKGAKSRGHFKVSPQPSPSTSPVPPPPKPKPGLAEQQNEEILNAILPPRKWAEGTQRWVQKVSSAPCTRADVIHLSEHLNTKLQQRQARLTGICPVRRELYSQCFDELIRQVTINCAERGLLLMKVRDEINMTIAAYHMIYESSMTFGMRKALQEEQGTFDIENKIEELEIERRELIKELNEEKAKCEAVEKTEADKTQAVVQKLKDEILFLQRTNQQLKTQLEKLCVKSA